MVDLELRRAIESRCSGVNRQTIDDFFARMDDDYFSTFTVAEISEHIQMSNQLDREHPLQLHITPRTNGGFDVVIVGFDYLSQFSVFCGLLSAFGLDIRAGDIYSFAKESGNATPRKIVDVFRVDVKQGETFDEGRQRDFAGEMQNFARLLAQGGGDHARERLNRYLTERIELMGEKLSGLESPVEVRFNNDQSPEWTVFETQSEDAFAFLYAVSNALAMRGVYIHKVKIRSNRDQAVDQFFIADRWGRKIHDAREQQRLSLAVTMIKRFTRYLPEAPDPAKAMRHFDQFLDKVSEHESADRMLSSFSSPEGMNALAHLLGTSDFLWDDFLSTHFTDFIPALEQRELRSKEYLRRELRQQLDDAPTFDAKKRALNDFKDRYVFLIDVEHLLSPEAMLTEFSQRLTDLAELVLDEAARVCFEALGSPSGRFTICGLGKFGGREMGYASDLELLFVHEGATEAFEALAHRVVDFIESRAKGIFHIDLRLRPYGDAGLWSTPFQQFANYYREGGEAAPFERQALIKLRWAAGDAELGRAVEVQRDQFTYSAAPWDWQNALHLRSRQTRELVRTGRLNVKYSPGGIVDIEYAVQYLQMLNGQEYPEVRAPNTLEALDRLRRLQIIREDDFRVLHAAYLFLRKLIDALRIVRGDASDLVLPDEASEEFKSLARRLGYRYKDWSEGVAALSADIRENMRKVNDYFLTRFSRGALSS